MKCVAFILPALLLLAGCSQSDAPSEKVERAAADIVQVAQGATPEPEEELGPYAPRDECGGLEGAAEFRAKLAQAIEKRDSRALAALAANDIKLDFGGGAGADELRRRLDAEGSVLWSDLAELLPLGCARNDQGGITIPWYFAQKYTDDRFKTMIVTGKDVPLLSPKDGKTLGTVSWDAVEVTQPFEADAPFQLVSYGETKDAYIASAVLRSPLDYRLIASRRNGVWSITSFIAGD